MSDLVPVAEARERIVAQMQPVQATERCTLARAANRVLAADCIAERDVPPCDNSAMDGYALRCADARAGAWLPVRQRVTAGQQASALPAGGVARIFTGAPVPLGADAVVAQEDVDRNGACIACRSAPRAGQHIRRCGEDLRAGRVALRAGQRLNARTLGLCAALGQAEVTLRAPVAVAVLSTGDELLEPGESAGPGQIYNSNRYTLLAMLEDLGAQVVDLGIVADDPDATRAALRLASEQADCLIVTGGASVGEADHVVDALRASGTLDMWRLAIKPGKPLAFGHLGATPIFCLPGNPVAVFVTFWVLLRPALERMQGLTDACCAIEEGIAVRAAFSWPASNARQQYLRTRLRSDADGALWARAHPEQGSHALSSIAWADSLLVVPPGVAVRPGDALRALPLR